MIETAMSFGTHCYVAALLRRAGLRRFSGPFDWIFSSPGMARHCVEDDFKTFLDRTHYVPVPIEQRANPHFFRCNHTFYLQEYGVKWVFNHHNAWEDDDYAYVQRCVDRFRRAAQQPTLLVQTEWGNRWDAAAEFTETVALLKDKTPNATLCVFSIDPYPSDIAGLDVLAKDGQHAVYLVKHTGQWQDIAFEHATDEQPLIDALHCHMDGR